MDIHRCRFIPYPSSSINALAFSHPSHSNAKLKPPPSLRLAIGRANGDIELWNPLEGSWYQETILRGGKERSIEGLAWVQDPDEIDKSGYKRSGKLRLFSIGYSQVITEWDLAAGKPLRHSSGNGGETWCMAAQPKDTAPPKLDSRSDEEQAVLIATAQTQCLAVGCADGSVVLLSTDEEDLHFNRILARPPKKGTRVLSLAFQDRHRIVAGHSDGTIRVYDIRGQQQVYSMTLGTAHHGGPKEILVWSVKCMNDGTIVAGDSTGTVSIWDGKTYSLNQRIQGHETDILDLAVSADGHSIFSGGMDRRTVLYRKGGPSSGKETARWARISHNRFHGNDIKAMAIFESTRLSIVASGGLDTIPIITPVQEFGKEYHRTVSSLPQQPCMVSASFKRLLLSWWDRELRIWTIEERQDIPEDQDGAFDERDPRGRRLVAKIALQGDATITSADLTANGDMVAVSTITGIKLFRLRQKGDTLKVQSLPTTATFADSGAKQVQLSPDGRWLVSITCENKVQISRLDNTPETFRFRKPLPLKSIVLKRISRDPIVSKHLHGSLGNYDRSINRVAFSSDSKILSVSDLSGYIDTWIVKGLEDLTKENDGTDNNDDSSSNESSVSDEESRPQLKFGQHWVGNPATPLIPKLPTAPLVLSFRPSQSKPPVTNHPTTNGINHKPRPHSEDRLLIITADNKIREYHTLTGSLTPWSRRNPHACFPAEYRNLKDRAKGVIWDIQHQRERLWVWGVSWLWMFDLTQDLPSVDDSSTTAPPPPAKVLTNGDHSPDPAVANIDNDDTAALTPTPKPSTRERRKRKRSQYNDQPSPNDNDNDTNKPLLRDTGAGSRIPDHELHTGVSHQIKRVRGADATATRTIDLRRHPRLRDDDAFSYSSEEDEVAQENLALKLAKLRREGNRDVGLKGEEDAMEGKGEGETPDEKKPPPHWHTFKYRPTLGIVPLGTGAEGAEGGTGRVEVALVERPLWEMDLPARYQGNQEWGGP